MRVVQDGRGVEGLVLLSTERTRTRSNGEVCLVGRSEKLAKSVITLYLSILEKSEERIYER